MHFCSYKHPNPTVIIIVNNTIKIDLCLFFYLKFSLECQGKNLSFSGRNFCHDRTLKKNVGRKRMKIKNIVYSGVTTKCPLPIGDKKKIFFFFFDRSYVKKHSVVFGLFQVEISEGTWGPCLEVSR